MSPPPDVFLSYSREDQASARRFAEGLQREGFTVWWDATLKSGEAYDEVTEQALRTAKAVVVLWSRPSVASRWVRAEATIGARNGTLVPVMLESCERPVMFELTQTADLSAWNGAAGDPAWRAFVGDIRSRIDRAGGDAAAATTVGNAPAGHVRSRAFPARLSAVAAALVIAAIVVGAIWFAQRGREPATAGVASAVAVDATLPRTAVAVMPFANVTGDPSMDYMGDGMAVELIDVLAKVPGLTVPSRTSTFAYRDRKSDLRQIASDLRVGTVLEGSVRSAGEILRVTASLVDAQTDRQLWSESYERPFKDVFRLQDELARAIVAALRANLGGVPASSSATPPTRSVEAYRLYLRGSAFAPTGTFEQGLADLDEAIRLDPGFARAYDSRAGSNVFGVIQGFVPADRLQAAESDARQALTLDPTLGTPHAVLGAVQAFRGDWVAAERGFRRATELAPLDPSPITGQAAFVLQSVGHLRRGLTELRRMQALAPADPSASMLLAGQYSLMGDDAGAVRFAELATVLGTPRQAVPMPQVRANAALRAGRPLDAPALLAEGFLPATIAAGAEEVTRSTYAALADASRKPAAIAAIDAFIRRIGIARIDAAFRKDLIVDYVMLGDLDRAFGFTGAVLDDYRKQGLVGYAWGVFWIPEMRSFRQDPRFQTLVGRLNLVPYWQAFGPPDGCSLEGGRLTCR